MSGSLKRRLGAKIARANDKVFAERVELKFKRDGVSDPDRADRIISAALKYGTSDREGLGGGNTREWVGTFASQDAILIIDRQRYPDLIMRTGDRVRALEDGNRATFHVEHFQKRSGRLIVKLKAK
jgi:hypothetical protein